MATRLLIDSEVIKRSIEGEAESVARWRGTRVQEYASTVVSLSRLVAWIEEAMFLVPAENLE
jgi:hypothetical protein